MKKLTIAFALFAFFGSNSIAQDYKGVLIEIRKSFDTNSHKELYTRYWKAYKSKPTAISAFAYGAICWQWLELVERGLKGAPPFVAPNSPERDALLFAIKNERKSGYPLAVYAWYIDGRDYVDQKSVYVKTVNIRDETGKIVGQAPIYEDKGRNTALEKKQDELIAKSLAIEPDNPMARYLKYARPFRDGWTNSKAATDVGKLLPMARSTCWEPTILGLLNSAKKRGNKGVPIDLSQYISDAKAKSRNGAYGKTFKILRDN